MPRYISVISSVAVTEGALFVSVKCSWGLLSNVADENFDPDCKAPLNLELHLLESRVCFDFFNLCILKLKSRDVAA